MTGRAVALLAIITTTAHAAIVAPPPGREVRVLEEHVLLVFDPLTATQTLVVHHVFEGATTPFGLLIPTPKPAKHAQQSDRLRNAIRNRLHPRGKIQRTLDVEFTSMLSSCMLRAVGDGVSDGEGQDKRRRAARAVSTNLGTAPEPLHDWLLGNGFTVAPAQAAWLAELRARGWAITGVVVHPPVSGPVPAARVRGPVISLTHAAEEPALAVHHPPFELSEAAGGPAPPIEIAVLSEWAVAPDLESPGVPFFADALTQREISRLSNDAGGLPWAFRRDGTLTAFRLERPLPKRLLHFERADARPSKRPTPTARERPHRFQIPIELVLLFGWGAFRGLKRYGRGFRGSRLG